jgi:alkylhydroperoxidase family enzyme
MARSDPKYRQKLEDFERRVLEQPGALDTDVRRSVGTGGQAPEAVAPYVDKVRRHAYEVTDADLSGLLAAGYTEDQLFELTVAAAYGAARRRLDAGLDAMASSSLVDANEGEAP